LSICRSITKAYLHNVAGILEQNPYVVYYDTKCGAVL
jgi:hypothetical protein